MTSSNHADSSQLSAEKSNTYRFGAFRLDRDEQSLRRGSDEVEIQRKALDLLFYLVDNRDRAVSKEEIQDAIWPRSVVTETALTRAIMKARKALGDDAQQQHWIKTVHGRGYRFVGGVSVLAADSGSSAASPLLARGELLRLRRHHLIRTLTAYGAFIWLLNQGAAVVWEAFEWQRWGQQLLLMVTLVGVIPVAIISWVFQVTPDGLKRPEELGSRARQEDRRRWISTATIIMLLLALAGSLFWNLRTSEQLRDAGRANTAASIAVLPFHNTSGDPDFLYFTDGLAETLLVALTELDGLQVAARTSSFQFRETGEPLQQIADRLGVAYLLEGSVQHTQERVRIDAALVAARTGSRLWSKRFDRSLTDLFALQDDIASSVAMALSEQIPGLDSRGLLAAQRSREQRGTNNLDAYQAYLKGLQLEGGGSKTSLANALVEYDKAVVLDPRYAKAWASIAQIQMTLALWGVNNRAEGMATARNAANRAIGYNARLALPYQTLSEIQSRYEWNFVKAEDSIQTAAELAPGVASVAAVYGGLLNKLGRPVEAAEQVERAWRLDPLNAAVAASLTIRYVRTERFDEAREALANLLELQPDHANQHWLRAQLALAEGNYAVALEAIKKDDLDHLRLSISAIALHHLGRREESQAQLQQLIDTDAKGATFQIAEVYAQRGDLDEAFVWLERAYVNRDPGVAEILSSASFYSLYADPRFVELAARLQLNVPVR